MHSRLTKSRAIRRVAVMLGLVGAFALATETAAMAKSLEGVWFVRVTLRNCDTGAQLGSPFNSLVTFAQGGTISESAGSLGFAPGQRSPGHGTWSRQGGQTYSQRMVALILFGSAPNFPTSPGFEAGWFTIAQTVQLIDDDHIESSGFNYFYRSNGELYRTGCSTATGERFN